MMDNKEILEKNGGKKFSICLMNPPYDRSLHLKFLEKVIEISDKVISIQPITWIQDIYSSENKNSNFNKIKNIGISNIEYQGKLTDIFKLTSHTTYDIGIITVDKNNKIDMNDELNKYVYLFDDQLVDYNTIKEIREKMISYCNKDGNSVESNIKSGEINENTNYCVIIPRLVGNPGEKCDRLFWEKSKRWGRIFYKGKSEGKTVSEYKKKLSNVNNYSQFDYIEFNTKEEIKNWINSQHTDFNRFCMLISSIDAHRRCKFVPYMKDYNKPWTDERFYEYFKISKETQQKIHEYIKLFEKKFPKFKVDKKSS